MLWESLRVQHFGHFSDFRLDFGEGARFVVIYGPNGAGKTTLLNGLRSALFGIPKGTRYASEAYADTPPPVLTARLRDASGNRLDIVRHKKEKGSLAGTKTTPDGATFPLDEEMFASCVGMRDRSLYESVFGFTLHDLEAGREILSKASFDEQLAGGALGRDGARRVNELSGLLTKEADRLWKPMGRSGEVYKRRNNLDSLKKARDSYAILKGKYEKLEAEKRKSIKKEKDLAEKIAALTAQAQQVERLVGAYPHWQNLEQLRIQLTVENFTTKLNGSRDAEAVLALLNESSVLQETVYVLAEETAALQHRAEQYRIDSTIRELRERIEPLFMQVAEIKRLRQELPRRYENQCSLLNHLVASLRYLSPEFLVSSEVTRLEPETRETTVGILAQDVRWDYAAREMEPVYAAWRDGNIRLRDLELDNAYAQQELADSKVEQVNEAENSVFALEAKPLVLVLSQRKEELRDLIRLDKELDERRVELESQTSRLHPSLPAEGVLPSFQAVQALLEERRNHQSALNAAKLSLEATMSQIAEVQAKVKASSANSTAPTEEALAEARKERDRALISWEEKCLSGAPLDVLEQTFLKVRELVHAADILADALVNHAQEVVRLREMRYNLEAHEARSGQEGTSVRAREADLAIWETTWKSFWAGFAVETPIASVPPSAMSEWRDQAQRVLEAKGEIVRREAERQRLLGTLEPFSGRLNALFPASSKDSLSDQIARLEVWADGSRQHEARRQEAQRTQYNLQKKIENRSQEIEGIRETLTQLEASKESLLVALGVRPETALPDAHRIIQEMQELSAKAREWYEAAALYRGDEDLLHSFDVAMERVATALGELRPDNQLAEECVQSWNRRLGEADIAFSAWDVTEKDRLRKELKWQTAQSKCVDKEAEVGQWLARSETETEAQLRDQAERLLRRTSQELEAERLRKTIEVLLDQDAESWERLASGSLETWEAEAKALREQIEEANGTRTAVLREQGQREAEFNQIGNDHAALEQAKYEEEIAGFQDDVDRYAVHYLAKRVLTEVMGRYARDNQPELLRQASSLIQQITDGVYTEVRQSANEKTLELLSALGDFRDPDRLSTGEREQLFLALRLAYVARHCQAVEPLPIALDDVLVNFDEERAAATLRALADMSKTTQVLFFTCHRDLKELAMETVQNAVVRDLTGISRVRPKL